MDEYSPFLRQYNDRRRLLENLASPILTFVPPTREEIKMYEPELKAIRERIDALLNRQNSAHIVSNPQNYLYFKDVIHIKKLNVINYKALQNISIDKLNKINIFAGDNNSGKTSVLEAIRLLIAQTDANDFLRLQQLRGKFPEGELNTSWVMENVKPIEIEGEVMGEFDAESNSVKIKINPYREKNENLNSANYLGSISFHGDSFGEDYGSNLRLFQQRGDNYEIFTKDDLLRLCNYAYYTPFAWYQNGELYNAHAESIEKKHLPKIIKFLQESIDKDITNITLVQKNGIKRFLVEHKQFDTAMDLTHFGDGLQNIFKTALLFATAQNGIILIDEMETAIHHSLLTKYSKFIQQLAEKFRTQVFITSHSRECIDAFVNNDYNNEDISMYNMELDEGKVSCKYITGSRYKELNDLMGIDLRD